MVLWSAQRSSVHTKLVSSGAVCSLPLKIVTMVCVADRPSLILSAVILSCLLQTVNTVDLLSFDGPSGDSTAPPGPQATTEMPAGLNESALIQQLLNSQLLGDLINKRVQVALQAQLLEYQGARNALSEAGRVSQMQRAATLPAGTPRRSDPSVDAAFSIEVASQSSILADGAGLENYFMHASLQQLHGRVLALESTVQWLATQQDQQEALTPADTSAASTPFTAAADPLSTNTPAAAEATSQPAGVLAATKDSKQQPPESEQSLSGAALGSDVQTGSALEDGFRSFQSASSEHDCSTSLAQEDAVTAGADSQEVPVSKAAAGCAAAGPVPAVISAANSAQTVSAATATVQVSVPVPQADAEVTPAKASAKSPASVPAAGPSAVWSCRTSTTQVRAHTVAAAAYM